MKKKNKTIVQKTGPFWRFIQFQEKEVKNKLVFYSTITSVYLVNSVIHPIIKCGHKNEMDI